MSLKKNFTKLENLLKLEIMMLILVNTFLVFSKLNFKECLRASVLGKKVAHPSYKGIEELDFQILLTNNYYVNLSNIHLRFPIKKNNKKTMKRSK